MSNRIIVLEEENVTIDLKDRTLAALLAWLIPGLGHFYQGRTAKAVLLFVCIMATFSYGCYLGGNDKVGYARVVYVSFRPGDRRWHYLCQIGVGLPALPALVQAARVRQGYAPWTLFMAPPRLAEDSLDPPTLDRLNYELNVYFDLGTIFTMIAGLLNILAIYDAYGGPVLPEKKPTESNDPAQTPQSPEQTPALPG